MISVKLVLVFLGLAGLVYPTVAISGGFRSDDSDFAQLVVSLRDSKGHMCGGSILHTRLVLTAAHCFDKREKIKYVVLGSNRLNDTNQKFDVQELLVHPSFDPVFHRADIALVYLKTAMNLTDFLPLDVVPPNAGDKCLTLGWGRVAVFGPLADELLYANFTIAPKSRCFASASFTKGQLCFHDTEDISKAVFNQDHGGPLICHDSITGINSHTAYPSRFLHSVATFMGLALLPARLEPISYATDVIYYTDWILKEADRFPN